MFRPGKMVSPPQNHDTYACSVARACSPNEGDNFIKKSVVNNDLKAAVSVGNFISNAQAPPTPLEVPPTSIGRSVDNLHFVEGVSMPHPLEALQGNAPPPFLSKTYDMVDDPATSEIVSWSSGNNSFVVWKTGEFARDLLPKYFKHSNFSSFVRQLNTYGFRKVDPDRWEFANEGFLRGHKHLLASIQRRRSMSQQQQLGNLSQGLCVELGKFGGLGGEIERLKRDKNVLVLELVRMRQQQQATQKEMNLMMQRLHTTEQKQQQMMSFLARAVQNPTFVAHLIQQNENSDIFAGKENSKKRCLANDGNESEPDTSLVSSPMDGQMVKYEADLTSLDGLSSKMDVQPNPLHDLYDEVYLDALGSKSISHVIGTSECESTSEMVNLSDDKDNGSVNSGELTTDLFWEHFLESTNPFEVSSSGQSPLSSLNTHTDNKDVPPHNLKRSPCIPRQSSINQLTDNILQTV